MTKFKRLSCLAIVAIIGIALSTPVFASAERGTKEEAKALVEKAAAFYKANGKEKAIEEFNKPEGQFVDRDLYLFAMDLNGIRLAHAKNQKLVGKSILEIKDVDDKPYGQEIMKLAKTKGSGWVDYKFTDPLTKKIAEKTSYGLLVDDIVIAAGAYKQ